MKKWILIVLLVVASTVAVSAMVIRGSGRVAHGEFDISLTYRELSVARGIRVILVPSTDGTGTIKADEKLLPHVSIVERDGKVEVTYTPRNMNIGQLKVETVVTMPLSPNLTKLRVSSAGRIESDTAITGHEVEIDASSAGNISVPVESRELSVELSSAAVCSLAVVCGDVDVELSSAAICRISGETGSVDVEANSAASFRGSELMARRADVETSSAGSVEIAVSDAISASASSGGSIRYKGSPTQSRISSSSGGSIRKMD